METTIPTPKRDPTKPPRMFIARSFDINKPGTTIEDLAGGVIGGTILQGKFKVGDEIEIRPGIPVKEGGITRHQPIFTEIVSLFAGGRSLEEAHCGGLVGVGTLLDPSLTKADGLTGNIVGKPGKLPPVLSAITLEAQLFERLLGTKEMLSVEKISKGENLLLDIGTSITVGEVTSVKAETITLKLTRPVCAEKDSRVALSRKIGGRWRLIGYGIIK